MIGSNALIIPLLLITQLLNYSITQILWVRILSFRVQFQLFLSFHLFIDLLYVIFTLNVPSAR